MSGHYFVTILMMGNAVKTCSHILAVLLVIFSGVMPQRFSLHRHQFSRRSPSYNGEGLYKLSFKEGNAEHRFGSHYNKHLMNHRLENEFDEDEYPERISYNLQKPHNTYEEEYLDKPQLSKYWPNHKYKPEGYAPPLPPQLPPPPVPEAPTTRRPATKPPNSRAPGYYDALREKYRVPPRRRPPPGWELVSFRIRDGNRTIHVRRFVRRPGGSAARPDKFYLLPPHNATIDKSPDDDQEPANTLGFPVWRPPAASGNAGSAVSNAANAVSNAANAINHAGTAFDHAEAAKKKLAKFLSLFTIIRFANSPCPTAEGVPGTCFHRLECKSMRGIPSGTCAHGFGVCCLFQETCGSRAAQNCTYFVNPDWPGASTGAGGCMLAVDKLYGVKQLRLDFLAFDLDRPVDGNCVGDQFVVSGQNANSVVPVLCGDNTGQHVYVDVDSRRGPVHLSVVGGVGGGGGGDGSGRRFRVKVTQLRDGDPKRAPNNCLQYYLGVRGTIRSFNYPGGSYTNDLNYAICIRKETGYCTITYMVSSEDSFQLVNVDPDGEPLVPAGQAGAEAYNCPDDYIVINGLRLCGDRLNDASMELDFTQNAPVTDTTNGPFIVNVRTNGNAVGRGFELEYRQNPCRA